MATARARTGGDGHNLLFGLDLQSCKAGELEAKIFDPWALMVGVSQTATIFECFFEEDDKQNLVYERLSPYNLLAHHIAREVSPEGDAPVAYRKKNGAKAMLVGDTEYLLYAGKIHKRNE